MPLMEKNFIEFVRSISYSNVKTRRTSPAMTTTFTEHFKQASLRHVEDSTISPTTTLPAENYHHGTSSNIKKRTCFLDLPAELRIIVYRLALLDPGTKIKLLCDVTFLQWLLPSIGILFTNHQIYQEARHVLLTERPVVFQLYHHSCGDRTFEKRVKSALVALEVATNIEIRLSWACTTTLKDCDHRDENQDMIHRLAAVLKSRNNISTLHISIIQFGKYILALRGAEYKINGIDAFATFMQPFAQVRGIGQVDFEIVSADQVITQSGFYIDLYEDFRKVLGKLAKGMMRLPATPKRLASKRFDTLKRAKRVRRSGAGSRYSGQQRFRSRHVLPRMPRRKAV